MQTIQNSLILAQNLLTQTTQNMSASEKAFHHKMQRLLQNPQNKALLIELLDRAFRSKNCAVNFEYVAHTLQKYGIADFFSVGEKTLLFAFLAFGRLAPNLSVPFFVRHLRDDTKSLVLDSTNLQNHSAKRKSQNITLNINLIGEEVLGEKESAYRIKKYEDALKSEFVSYISIKITTIFSQINIIDFEWSKNEVVKRLCYLYQIAQSEQKKQGVEKFINLDMEEFRDLELTTMAFMESIAKFDLRAGIVLQAYIPDSFHYLQKLFEFSKNRVKNGKPPIKIRFVKGANMESEETIASQKGWALPTFKRKIHTDSNYKKMLDFVLQNDNFKFINIGIASHNIFEIAYAYTRIKEAGALDSFSFEMLEGMSLQCADEISKLHNLVLYAPVCEKEHFNNAIAYLVRRLDENTSEDNFMRHFFNLRVDSPAYSAQKAIFLDSIKGIDLLDNSTRRIQNRNIAESNQHSMRESFANESDTDFILPQNRAWALAIKRDFENLKGFEIYPVIGTETKENLATMQSCEKMQVRDKINNEKIGIVHLAGENQIKQALQIAQNCAPKSHEKIAQILSNAAQILRNKRGELIGIAAREVGKTFGEIDAEVSEAIDFVEFYPHSLKVLKAQNPHTKFTKKGICVTIAPWNFPIGISAGSIAAPLSAGNVVVYKPSCLSTITGYKLCECFWEAGIPKDMLIFLPSKGSDISKYLLSDSRINCAVLTGGEETAYKMLKANPALLLSAETGGKNATIVTKMADRDLAIKNIIHSAFSNSGQKCSATSLLVLEKEVYDDAEFRNALVDATKSLNVGSPFELKNKIGALADKPDSKVQRALSELESHEEWVLPPSFENDNELLMRPCIKYGTKQGDFTHSTELFATILSVMCAENLANAIDIVNATGYGLTAGLESLDEREWEYFSTHIQAGNIYVNKPTTGAIVLRQPFGGVKKSAIGFGRKVGVYNYITQFLDIAQEVADSNLAQNEISDKIAMILEYKNPPPKTPPAGGGDFIDSPSRAEVESVCSPSRAEGARGWVNALDSTQKSALQKAQIMAQSYAYYHKNEFCAKFEFVKVRGEENIFSYTKIANLAYKIAQTDDLSDILGVIIASNIMKISLKVSYEDENIDFVKQICESLSLKADFVRESANDFAENIADFERVRYHAKPDKSDIIYQKASERAKIIISPKPLINGRFELLYYVNEKSVSISYHRYGNLGIRGVQIAESSAKSAKSCNDENPQESRFSTKIIKRGNNGNRAY